MVWDNVMLPFKIFPSPACFPTKRDLVPVFHDYSLTIKDHDTIAYFQSLLRYEFSNPIILLQALTHPSCDNAGLLSYQRLEFLGDAILGLIVTEILFDMPNDFSPAELTEWRALAVGNDLLAVIAIQNKIHEHIRENSPPLRRDINEFSSRVGVKGMTSLSDVTQQQQQHYPPPLGRGSLSGEDDCDDNDDGERCPEEEFKLQGQGKDVNPPKVLGDIIEALIAAILLDSGWDVTPCVSVVRQLIFEPLVEPAIMNGSGLSPFRHPVSVVHEIVAALGCQRFRAVFQLNAPVLQPLLTSQGSQGYGSHGTDHIRTAANSPQTMQCHITCHGTTLATSCAQNKARARRAACLQLISGESGSLVDLIRERCDCVGTTPLSREPAV
jgi:dsRNA-specific ribonuclease